MGRLAMFMLLGAMILSWWERGEPASVQYTCTLNDSQQAILAEELAFRNLTQTPAQAIQQLCNRELKQLGDEQETRLVQDLNAMARLTTPAAQDNAEAALAAGIQPPTITPIADQTHNVAQAVTVPIIATNPYPNDRALTFRVTGLPPGIAFGTDVNGLPQLSGKPTTAGTYSVTVEVYNVVQVKAVDTFTWLVNL